jgi:thiol-disulfide isomerase/thioredoxin
MKSLLIILLSIFSLNSAVDAKPKTFSLRNLDGDIIKLEDYFGKGPILLDFWATWCKPCVKSLPKLDQLATQYKDQNLIIFGINEDGPRSLSKVEMFVSSMGLTFPILLDENREVIRTYQVSGLPTSILLDKSGNTVLTLRGYRPGDEKKLENEIEKLLTENDKK